MDYSVEYQSEDFKYLWDGSEPGWILRQLNSGLLEAKEQFTIENESTGVGLIIEDDNLGKVVIRRMIESGVRIAPLHPDNLRIQMQKNLGEWLQKTRRERGWSVKELAKKLYIHPKHIMGLEQGSESIPWSLLISIGDALDLSLEDLVTNSGLRSMSSSQEPSWILGFENLPHDTQQIVRQLFQPAP